MNTIRLNTLFVTVLASGLFSSFAASAAGRAETTWPVVCDDVSTMAAVVKVVKENESTYGKCSVAESHTGYFGRPTTTFRQSLSVIFNCDKIGAIKFTAGQEVDVKKSKCELKAIKQTKLPGSYCGLTDEAGDGWKEIESRNLDFSQINDKKVEALSGVIQQQLILVAKEVDSSVKTAVEAVKTLKENSESEDLFYSVYEYSGVTYNEVRYYPGGNAVGMIFKDGTLSVHAYNGDDSIACSLK